jgi:hypothetical protein
VEKAAQTTLELTEGVQDCAGEGWRTFAEPVYGSEAECRNALEAIAVGQLRNWIDE